MVKQGSVFEFVGPELTVGGHFNSKLLLKEVLSGRLGGTVLTLGRGQLRQIITEHCGLRVHLHRDKSIP